MTNKMNTRAANITPRQLLAEWAQLATSKRNATDVPCNNCRACCYGHRVGVDPLQERPESIQHLKLAKDFNGYYIPHREDGACIHLNEAGCSIYQHRPKACRYFDCRAYALINSNTAIGAPDGPRTPFWELRIDNDEDRSIMLAARLGMEAQGNPPDAIPAIAFGIKTYLSKARNIIAARLAL